MGQGSKSRAAGSRERASGIGSSAGAWALTVGLLAASLYSLKPSRSGRAAGGGALQLLVAPLLLISDMITVWLDSYPKSCASYLDSGPGADANFEICQVFRSFL